MDVPVCPHCENQPAILTKWGSIAVILIGSILAVSMSHPMVTYWPGTLVGVILFCSGVGLCWVATERYSPAKHDAT